MPIRKNAWYVFGALSLAGVLSWYLFFYPRFACIDLTVNREQAVAIASRYLVTEQHADPKTFQSAVVFSADDPVDQYLQKALGFTKEQEFLKANDYSLFLWLVRFYKEGQKEEYRVSIDSQTGQVIAFHHYIDDSAARSRTTELDAEHKAKDFLARSFHYKDEVYDSYLKHTQKFDNREDYSFAYEKKGIYIPWSKAKDSGGAKLLMSAVISGDDVLAFGKNTLSIPDQFNRYLERQKEIGRNLSLVFRIFYILLLFGAVIFVVNRRSHLAMHNSNRFYIGLGIVLLVLSILEAANYLQVYFFNYPTTQVFGAYLSRQLINDFIGACFFVLSFMMPALAGEALRYEVLPKVKDGGFIYYLQSTFLSRSVFSRILLGYLVAVIMMGLQAGIFEVGNRYWDVWLEHSWVTQLTTSYWPFLAALTIGLSAAATEETTFRMFAISWGVKIFKNTTLAVVAASLIWGFGHSGYQIFPMWFRGVEVTLLGLFLSAVYLRYGIIPVVVGHFLFDVYWNSAGYLLGRSDPLHFLSAVAVLFLPIAWGIAAFLYNKPETVRPLTWRLNRIQQFNKDILKIFVARELHNGRNVADLRAQLQANNWDVAVIDQVIEDLKRGQNG